MEEKLKFIQMLHDDLVKNAKTYIKIQIVYLRQELLNLEKMLDGD